MPTIIESTIGLGGADYDDLWAWIEATDGLNLVGLDQVQVALIREPQNASNGFPNEPELQNRGYLIRASANTVTDATRYRCIAAHPDYRYPYPNTNNVSDQGTVRNGIYGGNPAFDIEESYFRIGHPNYPASLGMWSDGSGWGVAIRSGAVGVIVDGIATQRFNGSGYAAAVDCRNESCTLRNCIFASGRANNDNPSNPGHGNSYATWIGANSLVQNCLAYGHSDVGFGRAGTGAGVVYENCVAFGNGTNWTTEAQQPTSRNNASDDMTAPGSNPQFNIVGTAEFEDVAGQLGDYNLKDTAPQLPNAGVDLSATFLRDFVNALHNNDGSGWEISALNKDTGAPPVTVELFERGISRGMA